MSSEETETENKFNIFLAIIRTNGQMKFPILSIFRLHSRHLTNELTVYQEYLVITRNILEFINLHLPQICQCLFEII